MKETLKLIHPIMVDGKERREFDYDIEKISARGFTEAEQKKCKAVQMSGGTGNLSGAMELDYTLHIYLGFAAIIEMNPEVDYADLERVSGYDVIKIAGIGRAFMTGSEGSKEESSEEPSENTQGCTTIPPMN